MSATTRTPFTLYCMPDGTYIKSAKQYSSAWENLGRKIAKFFPGYKLDSYCPGLHFSTADYKNSFSMNLDVALMLLDSIKKNYMRKKR